MYLFMNQGFHWLPDMPLVLTLSWISAVTCTHAVLYRVKNGIIISVSDWGSFTVLHLSVCPGSCKALVACQAWSDKWLLNGDKTTPLHTATMVSRRALHGGLQAFSDYCSARLNCLLLWPPFFTGWNTQLTDNMQINTAQRGNCVTCIRGSSGVWGAAVAYIVIWYNWSSTISIIFLLPHFCNTLTVKEKEMKKLVLVDKMSQLK